MDGHSTGEMTQQIKGLVTNPDNQSLIPKTYMVEEENRLLEVDM